MEAMAGEEPPSPYAEEGKLLHAMVWDVDGRKMSVDLNGEQRKMLDYCDQFLATFGVARDAWRNEVKMQLTHQFDVLCTGYADGLLWNEAANCVDVVDFKFGRGDVDDPEDNIQMAAYAAMAMQLHADRKPAGARMWIFQPRTTLTPVQFTYHDEPAITAHIAAIIDRCRQSFELVPGEAQCRWCGARAFCPALMFNGSSAAARTALARTQGQELVILPSTAADWYDKAKAVQSALEAIMDRIRVLVDNASKGSGPPVPGLTFNERQGAAYINDVGQTYREVASVLSVEDFMGLCSVSVNSLRNLYASTLMKAGAVQTLEAGRRTFESKVRYERRAPTRAIARTKDA